MELESPRSGMRGLLQLFVLCCFSGLAILVACTWGLLGRFLRGFAPSPVALLQSFGDVQIYTEGARADTGSGSDMGLPPRAPIRRRMVRKMVAMAECDCYDRWYVMAHSLGSVVAFNGLMAPDYILPNYLEKAQWDRLHKRFKAQRRDNDTEKMRPRRPAWLKPTDALSCQELFRGLGGLVTYGSPLHLFVDLWPHIVMLNKNDVFAKDFRWLNVCSPTKGPCSCGPAREQVLRRPTRRRVNSLYVNDAVLGLRGDCRTLPYRWPKGRNVGTAIVEVRPVE